MSNTTENSGKGRPTPSRKEAQAAAKERARIGLDKKASAKLLREKRTDSNRKMREGMKTGEERYLPARDQGPVKRFVRDWVDSRISFMELLLPILVAVFLLGWLGGSGDAKHPSTASKISNTMMTASIFLLAVDVLMMRFRLQRALKAAFPEESTKGTTFYAVSRTLGPRFLRLPKPNVKIGGKPR